MSPRCVHHHDPSSPETQHLNFPGPTIRQLQTSDAAAYRSLRLRGMREHPDAFTSSFEEVEAEAPSALEKRLADGSNATLWGAFAGNELVGAVGLNREHRSKNRHKATLVAMFVAREQTGQGIGRALVDAVLQHARATGIALIVLTVTDTNEGARRLYAAAGFRDIGIEPDAVRVNDQSFGKRHMFLQLPPAVQPPDPHLSQETP